MELELPVRYIVQFAEKPPKGASAEAANKLQYMAQEHKWEINRRDVENDTIMIHEKYFTEEVANVFLQACQGRGRGHTQSRRYLETWIGLKDNPESLPIQVLKSLPEAVRKYMKNAKNHWVMLRSGREGEYVIPAVFKNAHYTPGLGGIDGYVSYVTVTFLSSKLGEVERHNFTFYNSDLPKGGKSVSELFGANEIILVDEKREAKYMEELKQLHALRRLVGKQYLAEGFGKEEGQYRWSQTYKSMLEDGQPSKVVIEDMANEDGRFKTYTTENPFHDPDDEKSLPNLDVPVQPIAKVFAIDRHAFYELHVSQMTEYIYDPTMINKLILQEEHKDLIEVLTQSDGSLLEDIVSGKTGGIFVLCTGEPGLGKTLTAEIVSEFTQSPLYKVQCSQLGINVDRIEENLKTVLDRAYRWKAILLIDEADVYIRRRSNDIVQNSIVGVFLRLVEYYKGILFMTSNLGKDVDDAIKSRATAEIEYEYPEKEDRREIWRVISEGYGITLSDSHLDTLASDISEVSGRDIKNTLKLVKLIADKKNIDITPDLIKSYIKYVSKVDNG